MVDLKNGGVVDFGDGTVVEIPPNPHREHLAVFGETVYEFLFYPEPLPGEDQSDRIHVLITDRHGKRCGWLMNVEDAIVFIRGLSVCMQKAVEAGVPFTPA